MWDAQGNLVVPGGKPLAEGISEFLRSQGHKVSPVAPYDYFGWVFHWRYERNYIDAVLQPAARNRWLIVVIDDSWVSLLFPKSTWSSVRAAGLMVKEALESSGIGRNVEVIERPDGTSPSKSAGLT